MWPVNPAARLRIYEPPKSTTFQNAVFDQIVGDHLEAIRTRKEKTVNTRRQLELEMAAHRRAMAAAEERLQKYEALPTEPGATAPHLNELGGPIVISFKYSFGDGNGPYTYAALRLPDGEGGGLWYLTCALRRVKSPMTWSQLVDWLASGDVTDLKIVTEWTTLERVDDDGE